MQPMSPTTDDTFMPDRAQTERYALTAHRLFDGERFLEGVAPVIHGGRMEALVDERSLGDLPRLALGDAVIAPGFVDLQLNGCGGVMFNDSANGATLETMHAANLRSGCTAFMPTLVSTDDATMRAAMALVCAYRERSGPGPVMGLHLEGPYISLERRGIHAPSAIRPLDADMRGELAAFAARAPLLVTLAPECVSDKDIRLLSDAGVRVALGHSAASYERCMESVAAGVSAATHLYNGMPPLTGREPGPVGAALDASGLWCGIIADGRHVHPASLRLAKRLKGDRCYFVSDALAPAGMTFAGMAGATPGTMPGPMPDPMRSFSFCGQTLHVREGRCVNADGTLGGSVLTMLESVRFGVERMGLAVEEALRMASLYPARMMGQDHLFGRIGPGRAANLVAYEPRGYSVVAVVDRGRLVTASDTF